MMPKNDRRAAVDAGMFTIGKFPVRVPCIGLLSYVGVNRPPAIVVTIRSKPAQYKAVPLSQAGDDWLQL